MSIIFEDSQPKRMTWSEVKRLYPRKCVIYVSPEYAEDGSMSTCIVLDVCNVEDRCTKFSKILDDYPLAIASGTD